MVNKMLGLICILHRFNTMMPRLARAEEVILW